RCRGRAAACDGGQQHGAAEHGRTRYACGGAARDRLGSLAGDAVEPYAPSGAGRRGTSMIPVRVLLADDHALVRAGIRALLESLEGVTVVAEAGTGSEVLELARKHHPDVVLLDISMPGLGGLEASALLKQELPEVRVVMLSMHANEEYVLQALRAGASGYMLKQSATASSPPQNNRLLNQEIFSQPRPALKVFSVPCSGLAR